MLSNLELAWVLFFVIWDLIDFIFSIRKVIFRELKWRAEDNKFLLYVLCEKPRFRSGLFCINLLKDLL